MRMTDSLQYIKTMLARFLILSILSFKASTVFFFLLPLFGLIFLYVRSEFTISSHLAIARRKMIHRYHQGGNVIFQNSIQYRIFWLTFTMFLGRFRNFQHFLVSATGATPATLAIIITAIDIQFQIFHPPQTRNLIKAIF